MNASSSVSAPAAQRSAAIFLLAWHALSLALLLLMPGIKSHIPLWAADNWTPDNPERGALLLAGAYLAGAFVLAALNALGRTVGFARALSGFLAAFCLAFLYFLMSRSPPTVSRSIILAVFCASLVLGCLGFGLVSRRFRMPALALLAAAVALSAGTELHRILRPPPVAMETDESNIATAFYSLHSTIVRNAIPSTTVRGGGISLIGDEYLLATGDGRLYVFQWGNGRPFSIRQLPYQVPLNIRQFSDDANPHGYQGRPNDEAADSLQGVQTWQFRVADVRVQEQGDQVRVFVSHHFWKHDEQCFVVRVSSLSGSRAAFLTGDPSLKWQTAFESTPCVPLRGANSVHENNPFAGMEVGGRLGFLADQRLLLTLGDHDFTGVESTQIFAQDPNVSYGKTILIHLEDGSSEIYSMGHRNPQGLYITPEGAIWSTEHGPQGGDELNLIARGANYGWPLVTYGTDYGSAAWPLNHRQGRHDGYQEPVFAWVPSIGVSNLVRIERDRFPVWKGDLLVASLHAHSLFRLRLLDQRVVFAEPIEIGERVRDIVEGRDGRIILWTDTSSIVSLIPAEGTDGAVLFATTCGGCHRVVDGATHGYGPDLAGVVGRRVGSAPGFQGYSPAMISLGGKWTRERLNAFLQSPQSMVPGTAMTFRGVPDAARREAIIRYLADTHVR